MAKPLAIRNQEYWERKSAGLCVYSNACEHPSYKGRIYCKKHYEERRVFEKLRYQRDKEKRDKNHAEWHSRTKNAPTRIEWDKAYKRRIRQEIINAYGGFCKCCGIKNLVFLDIDHINNDGASHRKEVGFGLAFYLWLRRNHFPEGFQVLCKNCNWAKFVLGKCPHERIELSAISSAS